MATYVTKKCPHCGYAYQVFQSGEQRQYGSPYKTCAKCFNHYWDTDIVEPALHGFENAYETGQSIKRAIAMILYTPMALLILGGSIWLLIEGEMLGIFGLAMGGFIAWVIGSHIKGKIDAKKHWDDIVRNRQLEYDKSMERLKDTNYLTALASFDKRAKKLLDERTNGDTEHYAARPQ